MTEHSTGDSQDRPVIFTFTTLARWLQAPLPEAVPAAHQGVLSAAQYLALGIALEKEIFMPERKLPVGPTFMGISQMTTYMGEDCNIKTLTHYQREPGSPTYQASFFLDVDEQGRSVRMMSMGRIFDVVSGEPVRSEVKYLGASPTDDMMKLMACANVLWKGANEENMQARARAYGITPPV